MDNVTAMDDAIVVAAKGGITEAMETGTNVSTVAVVLALVLVAGAVAQVAGDELSD